MRTWPRLTLGFVILLPSSVQAARVVDSTRPLGPIAFERNDGQAASEVLYQARARGVRMALFRDGFGLDIQGERVRVRLPGARPTAVEALEELTSRSHEFVGSDPSRWHTQIRHYGRVRYREVLPGIDLDVYGGAPGLEYDFRISPAADASAIQIGFEGARSMKVDAEGVLVLEHRGGRLVQPPPLAYQETAGGAGSSLAASSSRAATR